MATNYYLEICFWILHRRIQVRHFKDCSPPQSTCPVIALGPDSFAQLTPVDGLDWIGRTTKAAVRFGPLRTLNFPQALLAGVFLPHACLIYFIYYLFNSSFLPFSFDAVRSFGCLSARNCHHSSCLLASVIFPPFTLDFNVSPGGQCTHLLSSRYAASHA